MQEKLLSFWKVLVCVICEKEMTQLYGHLLTSAEVVFPVFGTTLKVNKLKRKRMTKARSSRDS